MSDRNDQMPRAAAPPGEPAARSADELQRANRALRTLSAGNRALLRASDEGLLLQEMCRVIVEEGGYRMAWVGYAEDDPARTIRPQAAAGGDREYLEGGAYTWADTPRGRGATGTAVRTGQPVVGRNIMTSPESAPWREEAQKRGFAAVSAFPLAIDGAVIGNLTILAGEADAFDEHEVKLLNELACDLGYGIGNLRNRRDKLKAEATIARMAFYDHLTGLPNRALLFERLEAVIANAKARRRPLALLLMSVGNFHEINETLGYRQGDQLLLELARRVSETLREEQTLARVGESELALLLPNSGADAAQMMAQRIAGTLYEPIEVAGLTVDARACIGVALFPGHGTDPDALIRRAYMAMHQARRNATDFAIFSGSLDQDYTRRLALMSDLRRAIEKDELLLYCQPKVDMSSGTVCGAEALVRWQHAERGMMSTGEFIKLAEHTGLIAPLTRWVLDAAFSQSYSWHEAGFNHPISVNLSTHDLRDPKLLDRIAGLFATWGAHPDWIQFELTESALMEDPRGALETLKRLKKFDVELFIDDFGTGYSSLSYLQKLPVDAIKIDQSFVEAMMASQDSTVIVHSTIDLGHNLDLEVVAEGVESAGVWQRLAQLGCDTAQGYYVGVPLPAAQFREWEAGSAWHPAAGAGPRS